jgi:hypothetical protein
MFCPLGARIFAKAINAGAVFVGTRLRTHVAALTAVANIVAEVDTSVISTGTAQAARIAVARSAGREALVLLRLVAALVAERLAPVL